MTTLFSQPNTFPPIPCPTTSNLRQLHARILRTGDPSAAPELLLRLALRSPSPAHALAVFESLPGPPDPALSNDLLRNLSRRGEAERALRVYAGMRREGSSVTVFSFPAVLGSAAKLRALTEGKEVHGLAVKTGFVEDSFVAAGLARMYGGCGKIADARLVFDKMTVRDVVSWGIMIDGYSRCGRFDDVFRLYEEMKNSDKKPDEVILSMVLTACGRAGNLNLGRAIHENIVTAGAGSLSRNSRLMSALVGMYASCGTMDEARELFDEISWKNPIVSTAMITGYLKLGRLNEAREIFDRMAEKDLISWSTMISGYAESDRPRESLRLFDEMRYSGRKPDAITMLSVLSACAHLGSLEETESIRSYVDRNGFGHNVAVNNAMIDMYAKCGSLERAREVFEKMGSKRRNVISWATMINACAVHAEAAAALNLFDRMRTERVKPNGVTFVGLLYACSHTGLVEEGRRIFASMTTEHGIAPRHEHYGCMVDLFGRAGLLRDALMVIETMHVAPNPVIWGSLMSACSVHGEAELVELAAKRVLELEPNHDGALVALSNVYAKERRWESVAEIRATMKRRGVSKEKGVSRIGSDEFLMADRRHKRSDEIYEKLERMVSELKLMGYVPDTPRVLVDLNEEEKEEMVLWHSEKLALSFSLISRSGDRCIRIVKNLRICQDCHTFMKLCSEVYGKEIVVRDRTRFHHFEHGSCSCKDYW